MNKNKSIVSKDSVLNFPRGITNLPFVHYATNDELHPSIINTKIEQPNNTNAFTGLLGPPTIPERNYIRFGRLVNGSVCRQHTPQDAISVGALREDAFEQLHVEFSRYYPDTPGLDNTFKPSLIANLWDYICPGKSSDYRGNIQPICHPVFLHICAIRSYINNVILPERTYVSYRDNTHFIYNSEQPDNIILTNFVCWDVCSALAFYEERFIIAYKLNKKYAYIPIQYTQREGKKTGLREDEYWEFIVGYAKILLYIWAFNYETCAIMKQFTGDLMSIMDSPTPLSIRQLPVMDNLTVIGYSYHNQNSYMNVFPSEQVSGSDINSFSKNYNGHKFTRSMKNMVYGRSKNDIYQLKFYVSRGLNETWPLYTYHILVNRPNAICDTFGSTVDVIVISMLANALGFWHLKPQLFVYKPFNDYCVSAVAKPDAYLTLISSALNIAPPEILCEHQTRLLDQYNSVGTSKSEHERERLNTIYYSAIACSQ